MDNKKNKSPVKTLHETYTTFSSPPNDEQKVSHLSIFNKIDLTVNMPEQKQEVEVVGADKQTDGCTDCFKSLFSCLKR